VIALALTGACAPPTPESDRGPAPDARETGAGMTGRASVVVRPGIDVLVSDSFHLVEGRRVGLITNRSGVGSDGRSSIDILYELPGVELTALFAPEHGIRGDIGEGRDIDDAVDERTGLPVFSLYGAARAPTPDMLAGVDALLLDLQDVGARYYTWASTMAVSMRAAGEAGIPFIVLDRPNPISGLVQGPVLNPSFSSFVGLFPVPVRHGMTLGELARLYVGEFGVRVDLRVVPAAGWTRALWFDETGLPWIAPSRNMPDLESAAHYPGTCLFEATPLSVGRGTAAAFRQIGAPWMDGAELASRLAAHGLRGVRFEPVSFVPADPSDGKYGGESVSGIRLTVTDRRTYDPVRTGVAALIEARRLAGDRWEWNDAHIDRLAGSDRLRLAIDGGATVAEVAGAWQAPLAAFDARREPYLLYPTSVPYPD